MKVHPRSTKAADILILMLALAGFLLATVVRSELEEHACLVVGGVFLGVLAARLKLI